MIKMKLWKDSHTRIAIMPVAKINILNSEKVLNLRISLTLSLKIKGSYISGFYYYKLISFMSHLNVLVGLCV
jgi:hypothetical protein